MGRESVLIHCRFSEERNKIPLQTCTFREKINLASGSELDSYEKITYFLSRGIHEFINYNLYALNVAFGEHEGKTS